jgi:hypothetical protein
MGEMSGNNLSFRIHRNPQKETNPNVQGMELTAQFSRVRVLGLEMVLELRTAVSWLRLILAIEET